MLGENNRPTTAEEERQMSRSIRGDDTADSTWCKECLSRPPPSPQDVCPPRHGYHAVTDFRHQRYARCAPPYRYRLIYLCASAYAKRRPAVENNNTININTNTRHRQSVTPPKNARQRPRSRNTIYHVKEKRAKINITGRTGSPIMLITRMNVAAVIITTKSPIASSNHNAPVSPQTCRR